MVETPGLFVMNDQRVPERAAHEPRMAPVAVFAFRRVDHLRRMLASLLRNPEATATDLFIFCDAAKRPEHAADVAAVRAHVESLEGFRSITRIYRSENFGLARSIIEGVTQILNSWGRVIVVEDDLVLSPHFLRFMNEGLVRYEKDARVASIHGYSYPTKAPLPETFFLQGADCWGWATWSRAWKEFEPDGTRLLKALRERGLTKQFDLDGAYPFTWMLEQQTTGVNDSWAIRWHASCYLKNLLTLYPGRTLVSNIGTDSTGTHCETTAAFGGDLAVTPVELAPIAVESCSTARDAFAKFLRQHRSLRARLRHVAYALLGR
jgi:hypothetical protein